MALPFRSLGFLPRVLATVFGLIAVSHMDAQPAAGAASAEPPLTVRLMSWQGDITDVAIAAAPKPHVVTVREFAWGPELPVKRESVFRLRKHVENPPPGTPPPVLAEIAIPTEWNRVLIVLAPAPTGSSFPFIGRVWDNSLDAHPVNTLRVLNLSTKPLAAAIGSARVEVAAGEETTTEFPLEANPLVFVQLAVSTDEWRMVQRGMRPLVRGTRMLCVVRDGRIPAGNIMPEARPELADVFYFTDRKPAGLTPFK